MNTFYLDVCVYCSTDQFVGSRSYYRSSQDQTLARETSNINRCSMLTQIIVVAQENAFCSDTQSLPTSPLGGVCRLDMNNSWHEHHRPHICACRVIIRFPPTLGQLYIGCLPRLEGYEQLGVLAGHRGSGGGGGSRLVGFEPRPRCSSTKPPRGDGKEAAAPFPPKCLTALTITLEYTGYKRISERNDLHNPHSPTLMFTHSHAHTTSI